MAKHLFKKGHKHGLGSNGQLRRDITIELISQLNEFDTVNYLPGEQRLKLHRVVDNLIEKALGRDEYYEEDVSDENGKLLHKKGELKKRDTGDLRAIVEIANRLEGRPGRKIVGPDDTPVQEEYTTHEEVRAYFLTRGIDIDKLPPPPTLMRS